MIRKAANRTKRGFSLSRIDLWREILVSSNFVTANTDIDKVLHTSSKNLVKISSKPTPLRVF